MVDRGYYGHPHPGDDAGACQYCWQIELFLLWLKRPLGRSLEAVWITVLAVNRQLVAPDRPSGVSRIAWLHQTALALYIELLTDV